MCDDVNAIFRCTPRHTNLVYNPKGLVFKHIARCQRAMDTNTTCPPFQRQVSHVMQEDEPDRDCPACRGETPPETP